MSPRHIDLPRTGAAMSVAAVVMAAALAGCTTNKPVTRFYSLMPTLESADAAASAVPPARYFELLPVGLPLQDDQPQLVVEQPDGTFAVLEQQRWLGPLKNEIRDALSYRLSQRFARSSGGAIGTPGSGSMSSTTSTSAATAIGTASSASAAAPSAPTSGGSRPVWRIGVDVQRFDSAPGRYARLDAAWTLRSPTDTTTTLICRSVLEEPAANDYPALVQAHRSAVARLADTIADTIFRLQTTGGSAACP